MFHSSHCLHILQHILLHQHQIYHAFNSTLSWSLATLVYLCKLLYSKYVLPKHSPLSPQMTELHHSSIIILFCNSKEKKVISALPPFPIHLFRSHSNHNIYPFPTLSTILSKSFQNLSLSSPFPSLGPYTTQTLILEILNLIHRILSKVYHCTVPHIIL